MVESGLINIGDYHSLGVFEVGDASKKSSGCLKLDTSLLLDINLGRDYNYIHSLKDINMGDCMMKI